MAASAAAASAGLTLGSESAGHGSEASRQLVVTLSAKLRSLDFVGGPSAMRRSRSSAAGSPLRSAAIAPGRRACMNGFRSAVVIRNESCSSVVYVTLWLRPCTS